MRIYILAIVTGIAVAAALLYQDQPGTRSERGSLR